MANPTIGFIGYGNMAQAIAEGLINAGAVNGSDIVACAAHYDKLERNTAKLGAKAVHTAAQVAEAADVVVIAIKPYRSKRSSSQSSAADCRRRQIRRVHRCRLDSEQFRDLFGRRFRTRRISNAPFRTHRWPSARACSLRKPTTRLRQNSRSLRKRLFSSISLIERVDSAAYGHWHVHRRLRTGIHRHVYRGARRRGREIRPATCHRLPSSREDGGRRGALT